MTDDFKTLAAQLRDLQDATKAQIAGVMARAEEAGLDPAGLRRFVSWKRKDEAKRAQQEAIDQQCRYLAGERETPAQLPVGCELSQALNLYRRGLTVRQVAEELRVSTGKAGKLKQLSRMFTVHVHETVDKMPDHDPDTGEITETAAVKQPGESSRHDRRPDGPGSALATLSETRSPATATSDSTEPVEVTRKDTWAGERGLTECIEWRGARAIKGYGVRKINGSSVQAHRAAWEETNGPIPDGLQVLHRCDNPPCVNVEHLFLGTNADNVADKVAKGRQSRGEEHGQAKLSEDQARAILAATGTHDEIAATYSVSRPTVSLIKSGGKWKHLQTGNEGWAGERTVPEEKRCGPGLIPAASGSCHSGPLARGSAGLKLAVLPACPSTPPQPDDCSTGEEPMQHEVARVVPPVPDLRYDPHEEAPPPFLDQRHKARATG